MEFREYLSNKIDENQRMKMILNRTVYLYILVCVMASCTGKVETVQTTSEYLEEGIVQLANPVLHAKNTILNDSTWLKVGKVETGGEVRYTTDGSDPVISSKVLKNSILISEPGTVKARTFHDNWKASAISEIEFLNGGIQPVGTKLMSKPNEKYMGNGVNTLFNNNRGNNNFASTEWIGSQSTITTVVELPENSSLRSLTVCFLSDTGSWIFPPEKVTVYSSTDGKDFKVLHSEILSIPKSNTASKLDYISMDLNSVSKFLKVEVENLKEIPDWHDGKNTAGWLFLDELIFNKGIEN